MAVKIREKDGKWWRDKEWRKRLRCSALLLDFAGAIFLWFALSVESADSIPMPGGGNVSVRFGNIPGAIIASQYPALVPWGWGLFLLQLVLEATER